MNRILCTTALCGALFLFSATAAYAEDLPLTSPGSPAPARQINLAAAGRTAVQQVGSSSQVTSTAAITAALDAAISRNQSVTATAPITPAQPVTATTVVTAGSALTSTLPAPTAAANLTQTATATTTGTVTGTTALSQTNGAIDPQLDAQYAGVLEGTIIANRTEANVRFFVEGQVYDLAPLRALGLPLPRPTAVLSLFNCDARQAESDGCYWDPYLLQQEGFFEVVTGAEAGALVSLSLREAGAPPANQIWVQNRTGERESIIVNNEVVEIAPASVQQFTFEGEGPVVVNVRNCISQGAQTACEWAPQGVDPGYYYALVKLTTTGANNTAVSTARLEGVVASSGEVVARPAQASCLLRVPTLNVRGGPGLEFPVIAKVRGSEEQPGSVVVVGFDTSKEWMQVSDRIALGGWVTSNPDFIICTGDMAALPVEGVVAAAAPADDAAEATAEAAEEATGVAAAEPVIEPVEEAPVAVVEEPLAVEEAPAEALPADVAVTDPAATAEATAEATPAPAGIPTGLARLVVNNGFDQVVRFTLDQKYRVELDNLSGEWDLQPGQSISILVYPGMIPFSVSTPWRGLSDNADVTVDIDQERALWLYFIPDPDGSGNWILQF